ncbi:MAG: metal ABC transporter substrate-binding protein [Cellulosilyticaceae bacterium]
MKHTKKILLGTFLIAYFIFIMYQYNIKTNEKIDSVHTQEGELKIVTSFYPMYMHVKELTKGLPVEVVNMTSSQVGCLHDYQLRVEDMKTLQQADVLVINGFGAESFINKAYEQNKHLKVTNASENLEKLWGYEAHEDVHDQEEDSHFDETHSGHNHTNEHIWVSVLGSIEQVKAISKGLQEIDPLNKMGYQANEKRYIEALETLEQEMHKTLSELEGRPVVLVHNSFEYLAEELGLEIIDTLGSNEETLGTAKELEVLMANMKQQEIKQIFTETQYKELAVINTVAKETGSSVYELDSMVTELPELKEDEIEYITRMKKNIEVLKEAYGL